MKIAFAAIIKGDDKEALLLDRLLRNVNRHVDGIFITITQPNEAVEEVCKNWNVNVSHYKWDMNFANARNFNFSQVPKDYDYVLWGDADDQFRGLEKLRKILEENQNIDTFTMFYLYWFDENKSPIVVHQKTQVIKNNGCVVWEGVLHEDFSPTREITRVFIKGIDRLHLSDEERSEENKKRNLDVSYRDKDLHPDDPRSYWNLGSSLVGMGKWQEAVFAFNEFMKLSTSDDEKYMARLRRATAYWALGEKNEAIDECRYAIGTKPEFPDAYHMLGTFYFESGRYAEARDMYANGLVRKPPYFSILVFNPREYDAIPLMNLAKCYFKLNHPTLALIPLKAYSKIMPKDERAKELIKILTKEKKDEQEVLKLIPKLKKIKDKDKLLSELEKIPDKLKSHPAICSVRNANLIKENSSGKDLVFFCNFTSEEWTPETAKIKGIGGSEEAVIWLAKLLLDKGWNVTVYNNCGSRELNFDGVTYKPWWSWNPKDKQDVTIIWRHPKVLDYPINSTRVFLDLHDTLAPGELTEDRLKIINKILVKSKFHRSLYPNVPDDKFFICPNGIDTKEFSGNLPSKEKLVINTSSPDRSLSSYIKIAREVKKELPDTRFIWAYGWGVYDLMRTDPKMSEWKKEMIERMKEIGIEELGRVSHGQIADLYRRASVFLYPSEFAEIDCISLSKAMAAGTTPVITDFAALGEKSEFGYVVHSHKNKDNWAAPYQFDFASEDIEPFVHNTIEALKQPLGQEELQKMRNYALERFNWDHIATQWDNVIK